LVGSNLFSTWREETRTDWEANLKKLKDYRDIEEWHGGEAVKAAP
jgi:hypothetical protein